MIGCLLALAKHSDYRFQALAFRESSEGNFLFLNFMTVSNVSKFLMVRFKCCSSINILLGKDNS